jgi:hypothetical protein
LSGGPGASGGVVGCAVVEHQLQQSQVSELTNDVGEEFAVVTFVGAVQEDGVAILSDALQIGGFVGVEVAASGHVNLLDSLCYPDSLGTRGVGGLYAADRALDNSHQGEKDD